MKIVVRNKIKEVMQIREMSIRELGRRIKMSYPNTRDLINRESLNNTTIVTLLAVAESLGVDIKDLYEADIYQEEGDEKIFL